MSTTSESGETGGTQRPWVGQSAAVGLNPSTPEDAPNPISTSDSDNGPANQATFAPCAPTNAPPLVGAAALPSDEVPVLGQPVQCCVVQDFTVPANPPMTASVLKRHASEAAKQDLASLPIVTAPQDSKRASTVAKKSVSTTDEEEISEEDSNGEYEHFALMLQKSKICPFIYVFVFINCSSVDNYTPFCLFETMFNSKLLR